MDYNSEEFRELRRQWMKKLEDSGFKDIEKWDLSEYRIVQEFDQLKRRQNFQMMSQVTTYYSEAVEFLDVHQFKDEMDREIWEKHVKGLSTHEIRHQVTRRISQPAIWKRLKQLKDIFKNHLRERE